MKFNSYQACTDYILNQIPMFQNKGKSAYKPSLDNTIMLNELFNSAHLAFKTIHVGGTNGKGSSSHMLASVLQEAGYSVGLFTSPHLIDFRERIRINGSKIPKQAVIDFMNRYLLLNEKAKLEPSFFELSMCLAFDYFRNENVDFAIIEVGLGGRLDSTNIIKPELCLITNVSIDHANILGNDIESIAREKAGIIKKETPVVISQAEDSYQAIFQEVATKLLARISFGTAFKDIADTYHTDLLGNYQKHNKRGVWAAISILQEMGVCIDNDAIRNGLKNVRKNTKLRGRWDIISLHPLIVCDTAHNEAGIAAVIEQIARTRKEKLWFVLGMVADKDINTILKLLPQNANYIFTQANISRALPAKELQQKAKEFGLNGDAVINVPDAARLAIKQASTNDMIYIGGSTFVVADYLSALSTV